MRHVIVINEESESFEMITLFLCAWPKINMYIRLQINYLITALCQM